MMQREGKGLNAKVWTSIVNCPDTQRGKWASKGIRQEHPLGCWLESMMIHSSMKRWPASLCCDLCVSSLEFKQGVLHPDSAITSLTCKESNPRQVQKEVWEDELRLEYCSGYCLLIHRGAVARNCSTENLTFT